MDEALIKKLQDAEITATPESARGIISRALTHSGARTNAIKGKCLQCTGFVRKDITNCTSPTCALWAYRPYQPKVNGDDPEDDDNDQEEQSKESVIDGTDGVHTDTASGNIPNNPEWADTNNRVTRRISRTRTVSGQQ